MLSLLVPSCPLPFQKKDIVVRPLRKTITFVQEKTVELDRVFPGEVIIS
jgi:hypothetical protein